MQNEICKYFNIYVLVWIKLKSKLCHVCVNSMHYSYLLVIVRKLLIPSRSLGKNGLPELFSCRVTISKDMVRLLSSSA